MKVYVDAVMAINFAVDFLLLLGTNRLSGFPCDRKRLIAAAMFGALYSGICLLPDFRFLGNMLWRTVSLGLMGSIAFGWSRSAAQRCALFGVLSLALGGMATAVGRSDLTALALAGLGLWCLCRLSMMSAPGSQEYVPLEIQYGEQCVKLLALRDTGNTLRDPITGKQVMVINLEAASKLTGLTRQQLQSPLETLTKRPMEGLRLIPFSTIGQGSGMMLAKVFEEVTVNGRKERCVVAFAPENFGEKGVWQALVGGTA